MIAAGVSELGVNTTIKIWMRATEEVTQEEVSPPGPQVADRMPEVITSSPLGADC